jgi:hypothetical protein
MLVYKTLQSDYMFFKNIVVFTLLFIVLAVYMLERFFDFLHSGVYAALLKKNRDMPRGKYRFRHV